MESYRVLVIGGGPIGLATALELAEAQHHVTVIEAHDWPKDKVCGEGLMPLAKKMLIHHNLLKQLSGEAMTCFDGIRYIDGAVEVKGHFRGDHGLGIRRTELSRVLYEGARKNSNIELYARTRLLTLNQNQTQAAATFAGESLSQWLGDFIVGADGVNSKVRKLLGIDQKRLSHTQRLGGRLHLEVPNHQIHEVQVYWGQRVEAYLTPCGPDRIEIAFMWERALYQGSALEIEDFLWRSFPELEQRYGQCRQTSHFSYQGGFAGLSSSLVQGRAALIGDAAYFFDGITGKGIALGFQMARWLRLSLEQGSLISYEQRASKAIYYNIYLTRLVLLLSRSRILRRWAFRGLSLGFLGPLLRLIGQGDLTQIESKSQLGQVKEKPIELSKYG